MRWIRRHPRDAAALSAIVLGSLILGYLLVGWVWDRSPSAALDRSATSPFLESPIAGGTAPEPSSEASPPVEGELSGGLSAQQLYGLAGEGGITTLPKHSISLLVTSSEPISYVGYQIPTSPDKFYGVNKNVGKSWSLLTFGYGPPDYAQIFSAAGARGTVTCTITIDGKVTERLSTDGPNSRLFCQV